MMSRRSLAHGSFLLLATLAACAPVKQYRKGYDVCAASVEDADQKCSSAALQEIDSGAGSTFLLSFVEFDDQGVLWDRRQMAAVMGELDEMSSDGELLMVVFVHGWKHDAAPDDSNVKTFREVLADLSIAESKLAQMTGAPARRVVGVYLGWRGASITLAGIKELTFWDRKNTAEKVGHGGVTEVLSRLDSVRRRKGTDAGDSTRSVGTAPGRTRLVVVGHSFGGAVAHAALSQLLADGFVDTTCHNGQALCDAAGFGDLVVLINPAFEALQFAPLSDMSTERGWYPATQVPVVAVLTSEADTATGYAFPAGRRLSTMWQKERVMTRWNAVTKQIEEIDEEDANVTALGHFEPYDTHWLYPTNPKQKREDVPSQSPEEAVRAFLQSRNGWENDAPGSEIAFGELTLMRSYDTAGRNPYLVVHVDSRLIPDHNQIADPRVRDFVKDLILISTRPIQSPSTPALAGDGGAP